MAFLPDGTMFFTEKCKGLSVRLPSGDVKPLYGMKGSSGYPGTGDDLFCEGQAGMQGVAVDPKFADNRTIYVYSTSSNPAPGVNRVMRMKVADDFGSVLGPDRYCRRHSIQAESHKPSLRRAGRA